MDATSPATGRSRMGAVASATGAKMSLFKIDVTLSTTGGSRTLLEMSVVVGRISIGTARTWVPRLKASTETPRNCILKELMELGIAKGIRKLEQ
jgi:hypothetical protein